MPFKKVTSAHETDGLTYTITDYLDDAHVLAYVLHQNANGWTVQAVDDDDRPADADRTYNPPAHLTQGN